MILGGKDTVEELLLSFHSVGPEDETQVIRLGHQRLYQLSHFTSMMPLVFNLFFSPGLPFWQDFEFSPRTV